MKHIWHDRNFELIFFFPVLSSCMFPYSWQLKLFTTLLPYSWQLKLFTTLLPYSWHFKVYKFSIQRDKTYFMYIIQHIFVPSVPSPSFQDISTSKDIHLSISVTLNKKLGFLLLNERPSTVTDYMTL